MPKMKQEFWNEEYHKNDSLRYNGTRNYIQVSGIDIGTEMTLEVLVNPDKISEDYRFGLIDRRTGSDGWNFNISGKLSSNSGKADFRNGASLLVESTTVIPSKEWTHIVVTTNQTETKIYVNGVLESTGGGTWVNDNTRDIFIGNVGMYTAKYGLEGFMKNVRIYDHVLSNQEVQSNYEGNTKRTGLRVEYLLSSNDGNVSIDSSGNGKNGYISEAVYSVKTNEVTNQDIEVMALRQKGYTGTLNDMRRAFYYERTGVPYLADAIAKNQI